MTKFLWSIWQRGTKVRAIRPQVEAPIGYVLVCFHSQGEAAAKDCAKRMEEELVMRRECRKRRAMETA